MNPPFSKNSDVSKDFPRHLPVEDLVLVRIVHYPLAGPGVEPLILRNEPGRRDRRDVLEAYELVVRWRWLPVAARIDSPTEP